MTKSFPASRKMRRSRESGSSVDNVLSSTELYNAQGEAAAALESLTNEAKETVAGTARSYNEILLTHVVRQEDQQSGETFLNELDGFERSYRARKVNLSTRKRRRNAMILAYNRGLVLFTHGKAKEGVDICRDSLAGFIERQQKPSDDLAEVASRTAFLIFECLLHLSTGRQSTLEVQQSLHIPPVSKILSWLESLDTDRDPQLKFQLSLYKTRLELAEGDQNMFDARIRSSRKELKSAMEVFQHKLRPAFGADTASVVSSANSEENMSAASTTCQETNHPHQPQQALGSIVLQRYNQAALNLKASSEAMKGNVKKSLILCSEAYGAAVDNSDYEAIHSNNLGLVYETNDKRHLALHVLSKGLNHSTPSSFKADGSASPSQTLSILYNSALCALRASNYISAYECMASCVARSTAFDNARCWLRMAEACLGIYHELDAATNRCRYNIIESDGEPKGLVLGRPEVSEESLVATLASAEDLDQIKRCPELRARFCLERVISYGPDQSILSCAQLSLAFILLAFREYNWALGLASEVIIASRPFSTDADSVACRVHKRRVATARLYAAEASCALGADVEAMNYLVGEGQVGAIDRLASDLGGVTLETAAANGKGKRRLAKAQAMVRSSASVTTAAMGNSAAAKQLAMSAQAMEDAYEPNREKSCARRALVYCLLREGNRSAALSMLQSMRNN